MHCKFTLIVKQGIATIGSVITLQSHQFPILNQQIRVGLRWSPSDAETSKFLLMPKSPVSFEKFDVFWYQRRCHFGQLSKCRLAHTNEKFSQPPKLS